MQKDKFESERLVMKILLNKGNDLNKEKWADRVAKNSTNYVLFPQFLIFIVQDKLCDFLVMESDEWSLDNVPEIFLGGRNPKAS